MRGRTHARPSKSPRIAFEQRALLPDELPHRGRIRRARSAARSSESDRLGDRRRSVRRAPRCRLRRRTNLDSNVARAPRSRGGAARTFPAREPFWPTKKRISALERERVREAVVVVERASTAATALESPRSRSSLLSVRVDLRRAPAATRSRERRHVLVAELGARARAPLRLHRARRGGRRSRSARRRGRRGARHGAVVSARAAGRPARAGSRRRAHRRGHARRAQRCASRSLARAPSSSARSAVDAELLEVRYACSRWWPTISSSSTRSAPRSSSQRGEALVELGARLLRERVVRRVADEDVPEPERVVAGKPRPLRPHELLAHERRADALETSAVLGRERLHGRAVEDLPLDGAALERGALALRELVEARRRAAPGCRRHRRPRASARLPRASRPSPRRRAGCPRRPRGSARADSASTAPPRARRAARRLASRAERLEQDGRRVELAAGPAGPAVEQLRRAMHRSRIGASRDQSATCSTRSRNASSAQWRSSQHDDERPLARGLLEQAPNRERDLLLRRDAVVAEQRRRSGRRDASRRARAPPAGSCFTRLDERPVRDALAVGEAAAAHDGRVDAARGTPRRAATCRRPRRRAA